MMKYALIILSVAVNVVTGFLLWTLVTRSKDRYETGSDDVRCVLNAEHYSIYKAADSVVLSKGGALFLQVGKDSVLLNSGGNTVLLARDPMGRYKYIHRKAGKTLKVIDATSEGV